MRLNAKSFCLSDDDDGVELGFKRSLSLHLKAFSTHFDQESGAGG